MQFLPYFLTKGENDLLIFERSERYFGGFKGIVWFLYRKAQTLAAPLVNSKAT